MYDPRDPDGYAQADHAAEMRDLACSERNGEDAERAAEMEREHDEKLDAEMGAGTKRVVLTSNLSIVAASGKRYVVVEERPRNLYAGAVGRSTGPERTVIHADKVEDVYQLLEQVLRGSIPEPMRYLTAEDSDEPF